MPKKVSFKLEVRVTYAPNGTSDELLIQHMEHIIDAGIREGNFTGDTNAEVEAIHVKAEKIPDIDLKGHHRIPGFKRVI